MVCYNKPPVIEMAVKELRVGIQLSSRLTEGNSYTRDELAKLLESKDATINTGIFQPRDYDSILLFVTERKSGDMTQYADQLVGDTRLW